jgi:hypothetical protein
VGVEIYFPQYGVHGRWGSERPVGGTVEVVAQNWGWERGASGFEVGEGTGKPLTSEGMRHV